MAIETESSPSKQVGNATLVKETSRSTTWIPKKYSAVCQPKWSPWRSWSMAKAWTASIVEKISWTPLFRWKLDLEVHCRHQSTRPTHPTQRSRPVNTVTLPSEDFLTQQTPSTSPSCCHLFTAKATTRPQLPSFPAFLAQLTAFSISPANRRARLFRLWIAPRKSAWAPSA